MRHRLAVELPPVELPPELDEWVREQGGSTFLQRLAHQAAAGQLIDKLTGQFPAPPHPGRSGLSKPD